MTRHKLETICYDAKTKDFVHKTTTKDLGPNDVLIRTTHSGLCTTDIHAKDKGCGLGHVGVGMVEEVGEGVRNLSLGQRVGWGWLHSVCFERVIYDFHRGYADRQTVMRALQDVCFWLSPILLASQWICLL